VFHDVHSELYNPSNESDLERYFKGCPTYQRSLAEQWALPCLRLEDERKVLHRVTAAFWDEGEFVVAADPWEIIVKNGASLVSEVLTKDEDSAIARLALGMGMTAEQVAFARALYERKVARPPALIELSIEEVKFLESTFKDPKSEYAELERLMRSSEATRPQTEEASTPVQAKWWESIDTKAEFEKAMKACREQFAELGIVVP
jgi:hypothetical protein